MGDRTVPFDKDEKCDDCGVTGAFDFMGDYFCGECAKKYIKSDEDDRLDDEVEENNA